MLAGAVGFVAHAPGWISALLEVAGWMLGAWLRRARRARVAAVRAWTPEAPPG